MPPVYPLLRVVCCLLSVGLWLTLALCACIALEVLWAIAISDFKSAYSSSGSGSGYGYGYGGYGGYYVKRSVAGVSNTLGGLHFTTFAVLHQPLLHPSPIFLSGRMLITGCLWINYEYCCLLA